jgi:hypothetical protein
LAPGEVVHGEICSFADAREAAARSSKGYWQRTAAPLQSVHIHCSAASPSRWEAAEAAGCPAALSAPIHISFSFPRCMSTWNLEAQGASICALFMWPNATKGGWKSRAVGPYGASCFLFSHASDPAFLPQCLLTDVTSHRGLAFHNLLH